MRSLTEKEQSLLDSFDFESLNRDCNDLLSDVQSDVLCHIKSGLEKKLLDIIEGKLTESVIDILLKLMSVVFAIDKNYRRNIEGFNAVYVFTDKNNDYYSVASFMNGKLKVSSKKVENPTFSLIFRNNSSLVKLLFSGAPDILKAMLDQEVDFIGNINYINKFAFMALHLVLELTGGKVFA